MAGMNTGLEGMRRKHDTARFVKNVLPNGVTIRNQESAIHVDEAIEIMGFLPNVRSQLDPQHKPGLAHFFEHMPFRGTKTVITRMRTQRTISRLTRSFAYGIILLRLSR